ncbi:AAA family ATPase [Streptomyces sp. NPDC087850]|uniref:helix-turn-helix transcriptional regulator n=1 Tax=Streptomyces sp. NPDC087850 TaxID=3365809 RepID=UPI00382A6E3C
MSGLPGFLVGRVEELRVLARHAGAARAGRAGLVVLTGPEGGGKSSLLHAFLTSGACRNMTVLYGACGETAPGSVYGGVRALFGSLGLGAGAAGGSPLLRGFARRALPALAAGSGSDDQGAPSDAPDVPDALGAPDDLGAPEAPGAYPVLHGLYRLAANLMAVRPLVLVLDDAHRCDEHSLRWLDFLLRRADGLPLLVVLARREGGRPADPADPVDSVDPVAPVDSAVSADSAASAVLADIAAQHATTVLRLGPLTDVDVAEMVGQCFLAQVEPSFAECAARISGGSPLVLGRLLDELHAEGVQPDAEGTARVAGIAGRMAACSVVALLDGQPPWIREVAGAIAVLGEADPDLVGALADVPSALVAEGVLALRRAGMAAPGGGEVFRRGPGVGPDFVQDTVRSAVLASLRPGAVARLRARAALLLCDMGRPVEEVARQLMGVPVLAEPWMAEVLEEAADRAEGRGAPEEAARCLGRVLELRPDSVRVLVRRAEALAETDPFEALRLLEEALPLAVDARARARVAVRYGTVCLAARRASAGARVLEGALKDLEAAVEAEAAGSAPGLGSGPGSVPADRELRTLLEAVLLRVGADRKPTVRATRERAARTAEPPGDTPGQRRLLATMSVLTAMDGRSVERTVAQARRALNAPEDAPEGRTPLDASFALGLADEPAEALGALDRLLRYGERGGAARTRVLALSGRALLLHGLGALPDALVDAEAAVGLLGAEYGTPEDREGDLGVLPRTALATVLVGRGEVERAEDALRGVARTGLDRSVVEYHWYLMARARARWVLGDRETALGLYQRCGASLEEAGFTNPAFLPWWSEAACLLATMNRGDEAREMAEYGDELAQRWGTPRTHGLATLTRGVIAPGGAGVGLLTEAVRVLSGTAARAEHARAEHLLGRALLKAGDQRAAREHLRIATDLAQRCGALALAGAARKLLVMAGGRMRRMSGSPLDMLTGTERRVAGLAAAGASNRSIAESLFVTVRTIETHLTSVYRKLGVSRRTELGALLRTSAVPGSESAAGTRAADSLRGR